MKPRLKDLRQKPHGELMKRDELINPICTALLVELVGALIMCQLAFFPFFSNSRGIYFHSFLLFFPFAGASLQLKQKRYMICSLILGILLCVHANLLPLDYFEMAFANPLMAIGFTCGGAFVIWHVMHFVDVRWKAEDGKRSSAVLRYVAVCVCLLVASALISIVSDPFILVSSYGTGLFEYMSLFEYMASQLGTLSTFFQIVFDFLCWSLAAIVTDVAVRYVLNKDLDNSIRAVFQRWLLIVVVGAFLVTTSLSYCIETVQALRVSEDTLTNQVNYLVDQVGNHESLRQTLKQDEEKYVLSKTRSAAELIAHNPDYLQSAESIAELRNMLGLASLTVCDDTGTVVADADDQGVGEFQFSSSEQTQKYMDLLEGEGNDSLVEDVRASIDSDGNITDAMRVFAGVRRLDEPGFVQTSVDANEFADALNNASIEHLVDTFSYGQEGVVMISHDDKIVSSNSEEYRGSGVKELFGVDESMMDVEGEKELFDQVYSGKTMPIMDEDTMSIMYLKAAKTGDYGVYVLASSEDIFANRVITIGLNIACYVALFAVVFALTTNLLDSVVVSGFKRTNKGLARITNGDLDERIDEHQTKEFDSLSDGINTTVDALKGWIDEAERRMERELATAKAIQESSLPRTFPPFPEVEAFDMYASMNAAKEVGGDFYDFFLIDDHTLGFLIADVSGKGIPGALFMMTAKTQIENYMQTGMPLHEAIKTANYHLCIGNDAGMFVTVWAATLDYETGLLTYVNAGHNFPLLRHNGQWEWLKKKCGLFLGTFETAKYRQESLTLEPGDQLILYTDGVNEAFNVDEEEYGNDQLEDFLVRHVDLRPRGLVEALRADVARWAQGAEQSDDITMLCLEYGVAPQVTSTRTVSAHRDQFDKVRSFIHTELGKRLCPIDVQNKIDIALEELFVNVCDYAYADQDQAGSVEITYLYTPSPSSMAIQLIDTGVPFDPVAYGRTVGEASSLDNIGVGGLGIMMTKKCVDDLSYIRDGNKNTVVFVKRW